MSSLPNELTSSAPARDPLCERVQQALVEAAGALSPELRAHVEACSECGFFAELSRDFGGTTRAEPGRGPLAPFVEVLDRAVESGEPVRGRYRLEARVGWGGQGVVYRANDGETGETVALKLVRCPAERASSSAREVLLAHRVRHPGVCRVYHTERHGDLRLISMEFLGGGSLAERLAELPRKRRWRVFRQVCAAVHAAHEAGVLHLDLKPQNILFRSPDEPLVTDFGLAVGDCGEGPRPLGKGGTRAFMAPEQADGRPVDRRTDVYALGRLLQAVEPKPPRHVLRAIRRATAEDPERRFPDVRALVTAIERPGRIWRRGALAGSVLAVAGAVAALPAPDGVRVPWRPEFGLDLLPRDLWNLALNRGGPPLPSLASDRRPTACARNLTDLNDGLVHYDNWQHGFAFPGPRSLCVNLEVVEVCGGLRPEAQLCALQQGDRPSRRLALTVGERERAGLGPDEAPGQVEPAGNCGEDDAVAVTLDRPYEVTAVRGWYHGQLPASYGVEVETEDARWKTVFRITDNATGGAITPNVPPGQGYWGRPVTAGFPPVRTRRVRLTVRCNEHDPEHPETPGQPVWLYEVEVMGRLPRLEAWRRRILGW